MGRELHAIGVLSWMQTKLELVLAKKNVGETWAALEAVRETAPASSPAASVYPSSKKKIDWNKVEKASLFPCPPKLTEKNIKDLLWGYINNEISGTKWNETYIVASRCAQDLTAELDAEQLEGEAALQKLFRDIYGKGDEDTRRAMIKSFVRSRALGLGCWILLFFARMTKISSR